MTLNVERLRQLAEHLRKPETADHFNMVCFLSSPGFPKEAGELLKSCGTVGCIAGHAAALFKPKTASRDVPEVARCLLGLTPGQAECLFLNWDGTYTTDNWYAAKVIDHLADTGCVDWFIE